MKMNKYEREKLQLRLLLLKKRRLAKTDSECLEMEILFSLQQFVKRAELDLRSTKLNFLLFLTQFYYFSHQGSPRIVSEEKVKFGASTLVVGHSMFRLRHSLVGRRRS